MRPNSSLSLPGAGRAATICLSLSSGGASIAPGSYCLGLRGAVMIHRILLGQRAEDMARKLLVDGKLATDLPPFSLAPDFVNCVRVFSKLEVVTPDDQAKFDSMLEEVGRDFGRVAVVHDTGAFVRVVGIPI